jgi:putative alpha-1,2-mannosidase
MVCPQDIPGLMEFMGGKDRFAERLDTLFDKLKAEDIHFPDVTV